ncbi:latent-transforming growth factor beta-binding protein 3 [Pungitius pungitius]|uniref:latent-transforming growth factor beta-binding protein 3 n=1 Tax=Pungitius pungitius TaxID=134920 RepID=UPI002E112F50
MGVLASLVALLCVWAPQASGAEGCGGFKHLENGQTFFRYGGLLVIFRCRPGYKLHGYKTNSCVSEHWSRDTPVCVGSGCPDPGPLSHGTSSTNEDGSWVVFGCNGGFQLHGPSMLYCKGPTWNSTKPVCKESDMMRSVSRVNVQPPNARQNLQAGVVPKTQQQSRYDAPTDTASEEEKLRSVLFSHTPSKMLGREQIKVTNPDLHLQPNVQFSDFKVKDGVRTNPVEAKLQEANEAQQGEEPGGGRHHTQAADQSTSSPLSLSAAQTPALTDTETVHLTSSALAVPGSDIVLRFGEPEAGVLPSEVATGSSQTADEDQPAEAGFRHPPPAGPEENPDTSFTSTSSSSTASPPSFLPAPIPPFPASTSSSPSSTQSNEKTHVSTEAGSHQDEPYSAALKPPPPSLRPVCMRPQAPAHGTFYLHSMDDHGTREHKQYIQYVCYPGYTLADGDTHSYCQQGDTWSGIPPVCLELAPCSVNHGGCSQLCSLSEHYNQSTSRTRTRSRCHCRAGFTLQHDGRTCRDINECAVNQGLGPCAERCLNSPGSYRCSCSYGYILAGNGRSCIAECPPGYRKQPAAALPENSTAPALREECVDINECQEGTCEGQCVNLPGSHRCICPRGYALHGDGRRCKDINECSRRNGGCSHLCLNQKGGYKCACPGSHRLSPYSWKKCLPRATAASAG